MILSDLNCRKSILGQTGDPTFGESSVVMKIVDFDGARTNGIAFNPDALARAGLLRTPVNREPNMLPLI